MTLSPFSLKDWAMSMVGETLPKVKSELFEVCDCSGVRAVPPATQASPVT